MKRLQLKEGVTDWGDVENREHYESNEDTLLVEAFKKRGYEIDLSTAYKVWLALSMDWDASWLTWQGDSEEMMAQLMKFVSVVE